VSQPDSTSPAPPRSKIQPLFLNFGCGIAVEADQAQIARSMRSLSGHPPGFIKRKNAMPVNVGTVDQYFRIVVGLALVAFAFQDGLSIEGWHWAGLTGFVLLLTAFFKRCPLYSALGISTCPVRQ